MKKATFTCAEIAEELGGRFSANAVNLRWNKYLMKQGRKFYEEESVLFVRKTKVCLVAESKK